MKKNLSVALLALRLTWAGAAGLFTGFALGQTFLVFRELMPGGVPLQTTFGFETLLRSGPARVGMIAFAVLVYWLAWNTGNAKNGKVIYTMNRLRVSELQATMIFGGVFSLYFLIIWAAQLLLCYGYFVWYSRFSLVGSNTFMLACWRSEWLHLLLPLGEWWGYLRNAAICLSFGFCAAFGTMQVRRGKLPLASLVPPLLCIAMCTGRIGSRTQTIGLTVLLIGYTIGYFFYLRGGRDDEDL